MSGLWQLRSFKISYEQHETLIKYNLSDHKISSPSLRDLSALKVVAYHLKQSKLTVDRDNFLCANMVKIISVCHFPHAQPDMS